MPIRLKRYPKRSPFWYMRGTVQGVRIFESTGEIDKDRAETVALTRQKEILERTLFGVERTATFAEAALSYMDRTGQTRFLHQIIKNIGMKSLHEIGQSTIDILANRLHPGCKPATLARQVYTPVISVLNDAAKAGLCARPMISKPKIVRQAVEPASDAHIRALTAFCRPRLTALIMFMTYSGARISEVCRLVPDNVNLREGWAIMAKTKNGDPRMVPLPPIVIAALANIMPHRGPVFGYSNRHSATSAIRRASERAGIPYLSPHKIGRHAFAARMLADGADIKTVKEAGGWKSLRTVDETYGHLEQSRVHDAILHAAKSGTDCTDNVHLLGARSRNVPRSTTFKRK